MGSKPYKHGKKGAGRFVQLPEWFQATEAWATLPPGPRALYIELKRRYNGTNNGEIFLSHRDAADALYVHRNTISPWFKALRQRGFIHMTRAPHLGPSGVGRSSTWALAEARTSDGAKATMAFKKWKPPA
ncbi:MAG: hypothetical protein P1U83_06280 [Roseovarius sp.]|nr:hypothetical protein [Roseovarius sp.]